MLSTQVISSLNELLLIMKTSLCHLMMCDMYTYVVYCV